MPVSRTNLLTGRNEAQRLLPAVFLLIKVLELPRVGEQHAKRVLLRLERPRGGNQHAKYLLPAINSSRNDPFETGFS